jgi:hypothetical protein
MGDSLDLWHQLGAVPLWEELAEQVDSNQKLRSLNTPKAGPLDHRKEGHLVVEAEKSVVGRDSVLSRWCLLCDRCRGRLPCQSPKAT